MSRVFCKLAKAYPPCSQNTSYLWSVYQLSKSCTEQRGAEARKIPRQSSALLSEHGEPREWRARPMPPGRGIELKGKNKGALSRKHSPIHCTYALTISTHPLPPVTYTSPPPRGCSAQHPLTTHPSTSRWHQAAESGEHAKPFRPKKPRTQPGSEC